MTSNGLFVVILAVCINMGLGTIIEYNRYLDKPQKFCGQKLPIEVSIICRGKYNEDKSIQRPKFKRGIEEECCFNPCTRRLLKSHYCAPEQKIPNKDLPALPSVPNPTTTTTTIAPISRTTTTTMYTTTTTTTTTIAPISKRTIRTTTTKNTKPKEKLGLMFWLTLPLRIPVFI